MLGMGTLGAIVSLCAAAPPGLFAPMPSFFEANAGQSDPRVSFLARRQDHTLFLTRAGFAVAGVGGTAIRASWTGASGEGAPRGTEALPGRVHHLIGREPAKWRTNITTFAAVDYDALYPGVALRFRARGGALELVLALEAGADARVIGLRFEGADVASVTPQGELVLKAPTASLTLSAPIAYQEIEGRRRPVAVAYAPRGSLDVGFELGDHDPTRPVIIDPFLTYATFLGGAGLEQSFGVAVDARGDAYLGGWTQSADYPATTGVLQGGRSGASDIVVAKLDPSLRGAGSLVYATYLGGSGAEGPNVDVGVDANGRAYVAGITSSSNFPAVGGFATGSAGGSDLFIAVLDARGASIAYSSYLGGLDNESLSGLAVAVNGRAYLTGAAGRSFPVKNGYPSANPIGVAFLSVFDPSTTGSASLVYSTLFASAPEGLGVAVDPAGDAYLMGWVDSGLPVTAGAFQTVAPGNRDYFVAKLDPSASGAASLVYSTYLGSTGTEDNAVGVGGIAVDALGNAYVTGHTTGTFPTTPGAYQVSVPPTAVPSFVAKLNPAGTALVYSTFIGGSGNDTSSAIAVDAAGVAFVAGRSLSAVVPTTACGAPPPRGSGPVAFLARLSATGRALEFGTFFTGNGSGVWATDLAVGANGLAYLAGHSDATNVTTQNGVQSTPAGSTDQFLAVLPTPATCTDLAIAKTAQPAGTVEAGSPLTYTLSVQNGAGDATDVTVRDALPAGVRFSTATPSQGTCAGTQTVVCSLGRMAANASATVQLVVTTTIVGTLSNTAVVSTTALDTNPLNDASSAAVQVTPRTSPCGSITFAGECNGTVLRYCEGAGSPQEELVTIDCNAAAFPTGTGGVCMRIDATYGSDCAVVTGGDCAYTDAAGNLLFTFCQGPNGGCVVNGQVGAASCTADLGTCTPPAVGAVFTPVCIGDVLALDCQINQPTGYDCAAVGGACRAGQCVDLPAGATCDATFRCASNLVCDDATQTCIDPADICDPARYTDSCQGPTLLYCDVTRHRRVRVSCSTAFTPPAQTTCGAPFTCLETRSSTACAGLEPTCVAGGVGDRCNVSAGVHCGLGLGCVLERTAGAQTIEGRCRVTASCTPGAPSVGCAGEVATYCLGNELITAQEAAGVDCASFGSRCGTRTATTPVCLGEAGDPCDDPSVIESPFQCAPGFTCVGGGPSFGTCQGGPAPDAGATQDASADSGTALRDGGIAAVDAGEEKKEEGCTCRAARAPSASPSLIAWIVLGALGFLSRRRDPPSPRRDPPSPRRDTPSPRRDTPSPRRDTASPRPDLGPRSLRRRGGRGSAP
ncbi:MAG: SBBP repeat-containing protein [Deltaproteobacteria bacterium]|nr:SBBP repeat-containing protein [Deltaproteobacteria bacterium]